MQKFIPDFAALGNIDWSKPQLDTKNKQWNIMAIAAVAMLITIFLPWFYSAGWAKEICIQGDIAQSENISIQDK